jgi:hypothetical protein
MMKHWKLIGASVTLLALTMSPGMTWAEGTEILSPAAIPLASGSGLAIGGTGLFESVNEETFVNVDGAISVVVPGNAVVTQTLLYWLSEYYPQTGPDATLTVNGIDVVGTPIGGPTNFFSVVEFEAFRADITGLGLVGAGNNVLTITGATSSFRSTGAGVLVVYDDGTASDLQVQDGLDLAYWRLAPPLDTTEPVYFAFEPADSLRIARIPVMVGSVGDGRPNVTQVTVGDVVSRYFNLFTSLDGEQWDTQVLLVDVPAGVSTISLQLLSESDGSTRNPASLAWIASGIAIEFPAPPQDCTPCSGKVDELTLRYTGSTSNANIVVEQKKAESGSNVVFSGTVQPGGTFTFTGKDKQGTLGTEISIFVNGVLNTKIHTSCSVPIGPGLVSGDFTVVSGSSRNGGLLCPIEGGEGEGEGEGEGDCDCEGKVDSLTLRYTGSTPGAHVIVEQRKPAAGSGVVFDGVLQPGDEFSFVGKDKQGTLHTEISIFVDGVLNTKIHTSCSVPIGPGLISGSFVVVAGTSRANGALCPVEGGGEGEGEGEGETDACAAGKPQVLQMLYVGGGCGDSSHTQDASNVTCVGTTRNDAAVRIVVSDKKKVTDLQGDKARIFFDGVVALGQGFEIDATAGGQTRLKAETTVFVFDMGNLLLHQVTFHTSCSQPLLIGDRFGGVQIDGFLADKGVDPTTAEVEEVRVEVIPVLLCGPAGAQTKGSGDLLVIFFAAAGLLAFAARKTVVRGDV